MYIDGQWFDGKKTFEVVNPATGEVIGDVADGDASHATKAIEAAQNAFAGWSQTTAHKRSAILYRAWQLMLENKSELATLMTREQGKPLKAANNDCLLYTSPSPRDRTRSRMPSSA